MLTYPEMAALGLCPSTKYGYNKSLPEGFPKPDQITDEIYRGMPLQLQIFYSMTSVNGMRQKIGNVT
jgi:hypothetical protein